MTEKSSDLPVRVGWSSAYLAGVAIDIGLTVAGLPGGVGTLVSATQALFTSNTAEATAECERTLEATPGARDQLDALRADVEETRARMTAMTRVVLEAGRHPDRELRLALGRFAARVLIEDLDDVDRFELAEALARMTALDFALLRAAGAPRAEGDNSTREQGWFLARVQVSFPALDLPRMHRARERLIIFQLLAGNAWGDSPTALGRRLLDSTREVGDE